jgi:Putative zinc-finger
MSGIVQNGLGPGDSILSGDSHDQFRELCAVSVAGELTAEETIRLKRHLATCESCHRLLEQYRYVGAAEIPRLAEELAFERDHENPARPWSIDEAEKHLLEALSTPSQRLHLPRSKNSISSRPISRFVVAAVLIGACSLVAFRTGILEGRRITEGSHTVSSAVRLALTPQFAPLDQPPKPKSEAERVATAQVRARLDSSQKEVARLKQQLSHLESEMARRESDLATNIGTRAGLESELARIQADNDTLQAKLQAAKANASQDIAQSLALKVQVESLNADLERKNIEIVHEQELLDHDRDIRNLIGARNLYIAEIYDVGRTGETEKPFGRVFYTKDKSLIFYGYDLDQQRGLRKDSAFQAWGRLGSDHEHDVNLGLLYKDDASQQRWVLRFNDAKTVAGLDAVFVTVEPQGGSTRPSGKPLLFTYLRLEPNHP